MHALPHKITSLEFGRPVKGKLPEELTPFDELVLSSRLTKRGVAVCQAPSFSWREGQEHWFSEVVGPALGSEVATYLNTPHKAAYGALRESTEAEKLPTYFYSCKPLDDLLLGCFPTTLYFDIGRGGPWYTVFRSMGYLDVALAKMSGQTENRTMMEWMRTYGLGGCIPLIRRRTLIEWVAKKEATLYAVPSTSIAEAVTLAATFFPKMRADLSLLLGKNPWLDRKQSPRDKGSKRLYEALKSFILEKYGMRKGLEVFSELTLGKFGTLLEVSTLFMEMVETKFRLQQVFPLSSHRTDEMYLQLARRLYDPNSPYSHPIHGAQADASELVVRGKTDLGPIPWNAFLLFGDHVGTTREQLIKMGELLRSVYPEAVIVVLTDPEGKPLQYYPQADSDIEQKANALLSMMSITWIDALFREDIEREFEEDMMLFTGDIPSLREWKQVLKYQR